MIVLGDGKGGGGGGGGGSDDDDEAGVIAGAVIGGVFGLALLCCLAYKFKDGIEWPSMPSLPSIPGLSRSDDLAKASDQYAAAASAEPSLDPNATGADV